MTTNTIPVSDLVNVQINLGAISAQAQNLNNLLVLGSSGVIDSVQRYREYSTLSAVAADFGTTAPEYLAATEWFGQSPQPGQLIIGQWNSPAAYPSGTNSKLVGGAINTTLAQFQAITTGSFVYSDATPTSHTITGLNFSGVTNLNGVANIIQAALISAGVSAATVVYNSTYNNFTVSNGIQQDLSFLATAGSGVDISGLLGLTSATGAYVVPHIASSETAVSAIALFDDLIGQKWYAAFIIDATDADHLAVAAFIQGSNTKHAYGVNTSEAGVISSVITSDIASQLKALGYSKVAVQYSSKSNYAIVSYLARILVTDYTANKSVISLMYKQEPGVIAESLAESQLQALLSKNANVFINYDNNTAIIQPGIQSSGDFTDTIFGVDWLGITIQNALYNALYTSPTKIDQTDDGNHVLASAIISVLEQGVGNDLLAPGTWTQNGFGTLKQGDFLPKGYYVYTPPISSQSPSDRAARKSVTFQVACKLAGAINTVSVVLNVNR